MIQRQRRLRNLIKGATGDWEIIVGLEVHAQVTSNAKLFSGASTAFGARAQLACLAGRRRHARHAAGHQRRMRRAGGAHRPRPQGEDQPSLDLRPQELLLSRPAAGLSDLPVQEPDRRRGRDPGRSHARTLDQGRHRAAASRAGRRQVAARSVADDELRRSQPLRRRADGDRLQARHALGRRGQGLCDEAAHDPALYRLLRRRHGEGQSARRRQRLGAPARRAARHALRDQERQFDPLHRPGDRRRGAPPGRHHRGWRRHRPGDAPVRSRRGETRSMRSKEEAHDYRYFPDPDLLPLEFDDAYVAELAARSARTARRQEGALHGRLRACPPTTRACSSPRRRPPTTTKRRSSTGASAATPRPSPTGSWAISPPTPTRSGCRSRRPRSGPPRSRRLVDLIGEGVISGKIAKDVLAIIIAEDRKADPRAIVEARGLKQVTDAGAIERAVDAIIAANPDKVAQAIAKPTLHRLVRRPGDEIDRRQGQSAGRQRHAEAQARDAVKANSMKRESCDSRDSISNERANSHHARENH